MTLNFVFTDLGETHVVAPEDSVLHQRQDPVPAADVNVWLTKEFLRRLMTCEAACAT